MNKKIFRLKRAKKTRKKLNRLGAIRLVVHKTSRHIYAQIIESNYSKVLVAASTTENNINKSLKYSGNKEAAVLVGKKIAERALKIKVQNLSFDRSGFKYHGRIKELADAARLAGLNF